MLRSSIALIPILLMTASLTCAHASSTGYIRLTDLIATAPSYADKVITTFGYICLGNGDPGVYISERACNLEQGRLGIGLGNLSSKQIIERENYGDHSYGYVTGRFSATKVNQIVTDSVFQAGSIAVFSIDANNMPSMPTYGVVEIVDSDSNTFKMVAKFFKNWIIAVRKKDINEIIRGISPGSEMAKQALEESLSSNSRLAWVLFNSRHSVEKSFAQSALSMNDIDVFVSGRNGEHRSGKFVACACTKNGCPSFPSAVAYLLKGGDRFCIGIGEHPNSNFAISVADLIY